MKIILEKRPNGLVAFTDIPNLEIEFVDWEEVGNQMEECPTLYKNLALETESHLNSATLGMYKIDL